MRKLDHDNFEGEGNGFELIGPLAIFDPLRDDTKQTIDDAIALGVKVRMVTASGDQLIIAKETGRRLGLGDHKYLAKVVRDGPPPGGEHMSLDEMIMHADDFAGVFPEHKYEIVKHLQGLGHLCAITGYGANGALALSGPTLPGLSTIVHAIRGSHQIFQRMRNYAIYACAVTIRIVVCFAILAFAYQFDFPPFMVLIIALLNNGTSMTLSVDRVLPSNTPDAWDLAEIFAFAVAYGLYLTLSTIVFVFVIVILETDFFENKFGVAFESDASGRKYHNDRQLHMIVYLQVAMVSRALIFVTCSHGFFFMERPSTALLSAFAIAQLISIIASITKTSIFSGDWTCLQGSPESTITISRHKL
ncbi:hypothetical protein OPQ81_009173 [Rhizoctonia solani]|nr:hypothetical protein OPQ81_009173 [Rhizoctonia solani]